MKHATLHAKGYGNIGSKMSSMYEQNMHKQIFVEGQLVLRVVDYVRRNIAAPSKFEPNWEGSYVVKEAHGSSIIAFVAWTSLP